DRLGAADAALAVRRQHALARTEGGRVAGDTHDVVVAGDRPELAVVVPQHGRLGTKLGEHGIRVNPELGSEDVHPIHGKREKLTVVNNAAGWFHASAVKGGERGSRLQWTKITGNGMARPRGWPSLCSCSSVTSW